MDRLSGVVSAGSVVVLRSLGGAVDHPARRTRKASPAARETPAPLLTFALAATAMPTPSVRSKTALLAVGCASSQSKPATSLDPFPSSGALAPPIERRFKPSLWRILPHGCRIVGSEGEALQVVVNASVLRLVRTHEVLQSPEHFVVALGS